MAYGDHAVRLAVFDQDQLIGEKSASIQSESQIKGADREIQNRAMVKTATILSASGMRIEQIRQKYLQATAIQNRKSAAAMLGVASTDVQGQSAPRC